MFRQRSGVSYQENEEIRGKYTGTGLGMSIVKRLLDKMNGNIEVHSKKDRGTSFAVTIPFKIDSKQQEEVPAENAEPAEIHGKRLLLVEDNELNQEIAQFLLTEAGAMVDIAWNGKEAIEAVSKAKVKGKKYDDSHVSIIAMTANAFIEDAARCREAGMDAHVAKPLDINRIITVIDRYTR